MKKLLVRFTECVCVTSVLYLPCLLKVQFFMHAWLAFSFYVACRYCYFLFHASIEIMCDCNDNTSAAARFVLSICLVQTNNFHTKQVHAVTLA